MMMPFEWDVRVSSKDHTVTAPTSYDEPATAGYTTIRGTTLVGVSGGCVDVAIARAQRLSNRSLRLLCGGLEDTEAKRGHLDGIV